MQTLEAVIYWIPIVYLLMINLIAFVAMWWDKRKASKQEWRVAEATLHIIGFIGGTVGVFAGMYRFRHKTQKRSFQAIAVVGLIVSLIIYWLIGNLYI
ncbi:MAG: DUF1294 domain-containing protein [Candidatus Thorarchaeota archaeon]|nr:DUF1294 domain-containing protein [Candidatus Thorarchaeota archaeon]